MKQIEICRKIRNLGLPEQRTTQYYILDETQDVSHSGYGFGITVIETGESCVLHGLTNHYEEILDLIDYAATKNLPPHLICQFDK